MTVLEHALDVVGREPVLLLQSMDMPIMGRITDNAANQKTYR